MGAFPSPERARVLWIGIHEGGKKLEELYSWIENKVSGLGFKREKRSFTPHITFGRIKKGKYILPGNLSFTYEAFPVSEVTLFRSNLTPEGPIYKIVSQVPLEGK